MNESRRTLFLTAFVVLLAFTSVGYVSCQKKTSSSTPDACSTVTCQNGGTCFKGTCTCPGGFEGDNCERKWLTRYVGKWNVSQLIAGSSDAAIKGQQKQYQLAIIEKAGDNTHFFIQDLDGNSDYDNIECRIGMNKDGGLVGPTKFIFSSDQVIPKSGYIIKRGEGEVNSTGSVVKAYYYRVYGGATGTFTDTVNLTAEYQP